MKHKPNLPLGALSWLDESLNRESILAASSLWNVFFLEEEKKKPTNFYYQFLKIKRKHMNIKIA